ncbi:MAG: serine/threonine-protein kinase [Sumerlaeia bacterium]
MIGKGTQGEIWEALQNNLERVVAIKRCVGSESVHDDFCREAFTAAQLDHPNIVPIYDIRMLNSEGKRSPLIAMKMVRGRSWEALLNEDRQADRFNLEKFLRKHLPILVHVTRALSYAHQRGIIHRDIKPSQVMIGHFGEVFLIDWGLAVMLDNKPLEAETGTRIDPRKVFTLQTATNPAGSPAFMAPEQAQSETDGLGIHTDIYLLGATLYFVLTGVPPHRGKTLIEAMEQAEVNAYEPLPDSVPRELADLVNHCMATDPADRPKSVEEVREVLTVYLEFSTARAEATEYVDELRFAEELPSTYAELSLAKRNLLRAKGLWPDNPHIEMVRQNLLARCVEIAIDREDFLVARLQVQRISDPMRAEELERAIDAKYAEVAERIPDPPLFDKWRIATMVLGCVLVVIGVWAVVRAAEGTIYHEMETKAETVALLTARNLSWQDLRTLSENPAPDNPAFERVVDDLRYFRDADRDIRYMAAYMPEVREGEETWVVLADANPVNFDRDHDGEVERSEEGLAPGVRYEDANDPMLQAFMHGIVTSELREDARGHAINGYATVYDELTSRPIALLAAQITLQRVDSKLRAVRLVGVVSALLLVSLLTLSFLAFFSSRRSLQKVRALRAELEAQSRQLKGEGIFLG